MAEIYEPGKKNNTMYHIKTVNDGVLPGSDISRVLPRQLSTGTTRGTQNVGYGNAKIDGTNNRITVGSSQGASVGMGTIPGDETGQVGFFATDIDGDLLFKVVNGTYYFYDKTTNKNYMQIGILPDGTTGWAIAAPNTNVADGIS